METANRRWADVAQRACAQSAVDARRLAHEGREASESPADGLPIRLLRHRLASLAGWLPRRFLPIGSIAAVCAAIRGTICTASDFVAADMVESTLVRTRTDDASIDISNAGDADADIAVSRLSPTSKSCADILRTAIRAGTTGNATEFWFLTVRAAEFPSAVSCVAGESGAEQQSELASKRTHDHNATAPVSNVGATDGTACTASDPHDGASTSGNDDDSFVVIEWYRRAADRHLETQRQFSSDHHARSSVDRA